jgi:hypothetical protein
MPGGKKSGKYVPDCKLPMVQKSLMRVYLRHNPDSPEPIGLILKRISRQVVTSDGIKIVSILPRKMKPFTWDKIRYYWENPVGNRPLEVDEKPDEYELSILDDTLTADQKEILKMQDNVVPYEEEELPITTVFPDEITDKVFEMKTSGKPVPIIARTLELSVREVNFIINGA